MSGETANQKQWRVDAETLRDVGVHITSTGVPKVEVRIPAHLAGLATAAWEREDEQDDSVNRETPEQRTIRHRAGTLALIGLAVRETGRREGNEMIVTISADLIGEAIVASDES